MTTYMMQAMDRSNRVSGVVQPLNPFALATIAARVYGAGVSEEHTANAMLQHHKMITGEWSGRGPLAIVHIIKGKV